MDTKLHPAAVAGIAVLAVFSVFITWKAKTLEEKILSAAGSVPNIGKQAPDFSLSTIDGQTVRLADYRGKKKVVVSFWASWCGPCRLELPVLRKFYEQHHTVDSNFEVVAVSTDDEIAPARAYALKNELNFPILFDAGQKTSAAYQVQGIPTMLVISESGVIMWGQTGFESGFDKELEKLLGLAKDSGKQADKNDQTSH